MLADALFALVASRLEGEARAWFEAAYGTARNDGLAGPRFARLWSAASRRLGKGPIVLTDDEASKLSGAAADLRLVGWVADECGRAALLLGGVAGMSVDAQMTAVEELFRAGELREQRAVLRTLAFLPVPARFVHLAETAVRANALDLVAAIACDNAFPARYMPDHTFNQMVMKSLFNQLPLGRVVGLAERRNVDLARMVRGWVAERRAAGRPVPDDVKLVLEEAP